MKNKRLLNKQKGFTLIELMVSVTIIGILTVIAVINFGGTNKKARDGRRMADLEKVRVALEIYKQEKGAYPVASGSIPNSLITGGYMQSAPVDPKAPAFGYYYIGSGYSYTLDAHMENMGSTNGTGNYSNNCVGVCNYRVVSP